MKTSSRRDFFKKVSLGMVAAAITPDVVGSGVISAPEILPGSAKGANDRIRIAVLGVNGRGQSHIDEIMKISKEYNVELAALCDSDMDVLQKRAEKVKSKYGKKVHIEQDFRKVYDDKEIDAVTLATPNHWHALQTIWACQSGKDVYVEKPATHNIYEGRKMIEAAYKYNRIVQHGVQLRSSVAIREAVQHLKSGLIGRVYMSRGVVYRWRPDIGNKGISQKPAGLDYDLWCGH